jgi:SpoVK/Ycf46/Vps4 family AAA+-type ATPase
MADDDDDTDDDEPFDLDFLASNDISGDMTGAEIVGACREAAMRALRESIEKGTSPRVRNEDLQNALCSVKPLLSNESIRNDYLSFRL